jgi:hypothetical protein
MKLFALMLLISTNLFAQATVVENIKLTLIDGNEQKEVLLEAHVDNVTINDFAPLDPKTQNRPTKKFTLKKATDETRESSIEWVINVQGGFASVLSNTTKIPRDTGTEFDLPNGVVESLRIYLSAIIKGNHEIRLLFAPLEYEGNVTSDEEILFNGVKLLAGETFETGYKFNSYRLSYLYHFNSKGRIQYRIGFTGKIRDAYTLVRQDGVETKFSNIGFVPLLHLGVNIIVTDRLSWDSEVEGSWAPQGYALDFRSSLNYQISDNFSVGTGFGFLTGGAAAGSVETFSDIFFGFVGIRFNF